MKKLLKDVLNKQISKKNNKLLHFRTVTASVINEKVAKGYAIMSKFQKKIRTNIFRSCKKVNFNLKILDLSTSENKCLFEQKI
jgi:hypothetical protein